MLSAVWTLVAAVAWAAPLGSAPGPSCADPALGPPDAPLLALSGWPALGPDREPMAVNGTWRLAPVAPGSTPWRRLESNEPTAPRCAWEAVTPSGHRLVLEWSAPFAREQARFTLAIARGDDVVARASRPPGVAAWGGWGLVEACGGIPGVGVDRCADRGTPPVFHPGAASLAPTEAALTPRACQEPEAQLLGGLRVRLEEWPEVDRAGFEMSTGGTVTLSAAGAGDPDALCTWRGTLGSGHAVELALARGERGRIVRLRVLSPSGVVLASGERGAAASLRGVWALRGDCTTWCTAWRRPHGPETRWLPGAAIVAGSDEEAVAFAQGDALLEPPAALSQQLATGLPNPDGNLTFDLAMRAFNLDVRSRRQVAVAAARTLQSASPEARRRAAYVLGRLGAGARPAVPALARTLSDPDPGVASTAAEALAELDGEAAPAARELARLLARPAGTWGRAAAAKALGASGAAGRPHVPVLIAALRDRESWLAAAAAGALGGIGSAEPRVMQALAAALSSPSGAVRLAAARALEALGERGKALAALGAILDSADPNDRQNAVDALAALGPAATALAAKALADDAFLVRRRARLALARIGTPEALRLLREHDATPASPRFWDDLWHAAGRREPIPPETLAVLDAFLPWGRGVWRIRSDRLVLYGGENLGEAVADMGRVGAAACDPSGHRCQGEDAIVSVLERRRDLVRLRMPNGDEGWSRRSTFRARTRLVVDAGGKVLGELAPTVDFLGERATLGVRIDGDRLALELSREGGGFLFELDPRSLWVVRVERTGPPWESNRSRAALPTKVEPSEPLPVPDGVRALLPTGDRFLLRAGELLVVW